MHGPGHAFRPMALDNLGCGLEERYDSSLQVVSDIEEAISLVREALDISLPVHQSRSRWLGRSAKLQFKRLKYVYGENACTQK